MARAVYGGFVAISGPIPTYPDRVVPPYVMHRLAEEIREGRTPMNALHDPRNRMNPKILSVEVKDVGDGEIGVWVEFEVEEEEWKKHGNLRGFSATFIESYIKPSPEDGPPVITIAADAGCFEDQKLEAAVATLQPHFSVQAGRMYQLSEVVEARVIFEMAVAVLQALPSDLVASAVYDALKTFLQRPNSNSEVGGTDSEVGETDFNFRVHREDGTVVEAALRTSRKEHLEVAVDALRDLGRPELEGKTVEFDPETKEWK